MDKAPRRAIALRYDQEQDAAPLIVASGQGNLAERILELAEQAGVPVRSDPVLAQALAQLELQSEVPYQLYVAVAELLVWAWELDGGQNRQKTARGG